ncbi:hypothetical protein FKM82_028900 [Ascaphus truei]
MCALPEDHRPASCNMFSGHIILNPKTFIRMREKEEQRERGLQGNKKCENGSHPEKNLPLTKAAHINF